MTRIIEDYDMIPEAIPPEFEQFVKHELASGNYQSAEEVVCDALQLLRDRKLYELRQKGDAGLQQLERGEGIEFKDDQALADFFEDIKVRGQERLEAKRSGA